RQEQTQQEQGGDHAGGQTGTAADSGARGGLDVAGGGGCTQQGPEHGGSAGSHQGAAQTRQLAVLVHQIGLLGHTDQGAGGVEPVDEEVGEDHRDQPRVERPADVQLEEGGRQARRCGNKAGGLGQAEQQADPGNDQNADHY